MKSKKIIWFFLVIITVIFCACVFIKFTFLKEGCNNLIKENNSDKVLRKITEMARSGNMQAQSDLGHLYENGNGVQKDYKKAFDWYHKSAEQGYAIAQYNVGVAYEYGSGVQRSLAQALEWYSKAVTQGVTKAKVNLGMIYLDSMVNFKDYNKAKHWFLLAAQDKDTIAMNNLGYIYKEGLGVSKNDNEAMKWYQKAADLGSMKGRNMLALYYLQELGNIPLDIKKAHLLLKASVCQGYAIAQNNLGIIYSKGVSEIEKNDQQAYAWFAVAASSGMKDAKEELVNVESHMSSKELTEAKYLANKYIKQYAVPVNEDDKYKSTTDCKYP